MNEREWPNYFWESDDKYRAELMLSDLIMGLDIIYGERIRQVIRHRRSESARLTAAKKQRFELLRPLFPKGSTGGKAASVLADAGISDISICKRMSDEDILSLHNAGKTTLALIRGAQETSGA